MDDQRMDDDSAAWRRLGELLVQRRVELGFRDREAFARARGLAHSRILFDLENAKRDNYAPSTRADVERIYGWEYGSVQAVLDGGAPTPAEADRPLEAYDDVELLAELIGRAAQRKQAPAASSDDDVGGESLRLAADRRPTDAPVFSERDRRTRGRKGQ
jgi:hypothetical protein